MDVLEQLTEETSQLSHHFDSVIMWGANGIGLTQYTFWLIIILALVLLVVLLASKKLTIIPKSKFVNMVEYGYEFVRKDIGEGVIGHGFKKHIPFLATMFFFILIANFIGLIPGCKTPTNSLSITWALSIISFCYFVFWGCKAHGVLGYVKSLAPSGLPIFLVPVIWVIELISTLLRALTLAVRLYGNMFAGHMVLGVFATATSVFIGSAIQNADFIVALPAVGWMAFLIIMYLLEVLVAFIQAYVFTTLSAVYISMATTDH